MLEYLFSKRCSDFGYEATSLLKLYFILNIIMAELRTKDCFKSILYGLRNYGRSFDRPFMMMSALSL